MRRTAFRTPLRLAVLGLSLFAGPAARAQRDAKVPDPDPELERGALQVAEGFEVNLFAADPLLAKPLEINFDAAGRLWVACSEVYPQIRPGQKANDKVLILEDRDGDGRADRTTVFADGLLIPTGIEPGDGGAYVANSTELLHLKDTDGDGKADARRIVLSGFGTEDTHHILHTLRWGHDGHLYMHQSVYIHSHVETPYGVRRLNGGGAWRFRPEAMRLGVFYRGLVNPWGFHVDRWGQVFATDGAGGEGINYVIPGAYYFWAVDAPRILPGLNPGSPKYCGLEVIDGRHLPESWRGSLITNDFRANRVVRFVVSDDGSGFSAREQPELIKTTHRAFRPIDVKMGPDGAIYVADWYNPIIQHGEVDFRDPRRDHTRGRIWRITAKGRPLVERPSLVDAPIPALLEALKAPEGWTRHFAKRVLKERGAGPVVPALAAWVKGLDAKDSEAEHHRLEALWVDQALDVAEPELLAGLLHAADFRVRAAAVRVVGDWKERLSDPLALLAEAVADEHPRVRLEAVRVLATLPDARAAGVALRALDRPRDRFLDYALWLTVHELRSSWLPALQAGRLDFGGDPRKLAFALEAGGSAAVVGPLLAQIKAGAIAPAQEEGVLRLAAALGSPGDLSALLDLATADPARSARRLEALADAARRRKVVPEGDPARIRALLTSDDEPTRAAAYRLAGLWKVEALRPMLADAARSDATGESARRGAIEGLAAFGRGAAGPALEALARGEGPKAARAPAVAAMIGLDAAAGSDLAAAFLASGPGAGEVNEVLAGAMGRRGGPEALAKALAGRRLPPDVAKLAARAARASGRTDQALLDALARAGGLGAGAKALTDEERARMVADVASQGDPARGESVFRRKDLNCLGCHAIAGAGGQVGPDLASIGASAPVDYLIDSVLQPNKAIKEGYHSIVVATDDGRVLTGIKLRQTDAEMALRDAEGREITLATASIEDQKPGESLMPSGLADELTRPELIDLVRFLSELGKPGPYAVGNARVVRRWEALTGDPGSAEVSWTPTYSRVSGSLPMADLPRGPGGRIVVRFALDVTTGGPVRLAWNSSDGLTARSGPLTGPSADRNEADVVLQPGTHRIELDVDPARKEDLRFELRDVPGSPARAQLVLGK